jgi:uncharacterized caspase-like protein/TPR repeat protein
MWRRAGFFFAATIALAQMWAGGALAERRVALVIGNSAYKHAAKLPNPVNDAADVGNALKKLGFEVDIVTDLDKRAMDKVFNKFAKAALGADAAVFYYSGHGLQFEGKNYVVPVDAELDDPEDVRYELARVDDVLADLKNASGVRMLVLDACRDNPLAAQLKARVGGTRSSGVSRGLAKMENAEGTLIAYATQSEAVADDGSGRNSPFTGSFLKHVETPGLEIRTLFARVRQDVYNATGRKQLPELSDSVIGEFYLRQADGTVIANLPRPPEKAANAPAQPADEGGRSWIGVRVQPADQASGAGAKIVAIDDRGPGKPAGLEVNDVIVRFDGKDVRSARDVGDAVGAVPPGRSVDMVVSRRGAEVTRRIIVGRADDVAKATEQQLRTAAIAVAGNPGDSCDRLTASPDDSRRPAGLSPVDPKSLNVPLATAACRAATEAKPTEARYHFQLGRALRFGRDFDGARGEFEKAAGVRYPAAVCALGFMHFFGTGYPVKDPQAAARLFEDAAQLGDAVCANRTGLLYRKGDLVPPNPAKAALYFRRSAEAGNHHGMVNFGFALSRGLGVPQDFRAGRFWYEKAAALGNLTAKNNLVHHYAVGLGGFRPDPVGAAEMALAAYKEGNEVTRKWMVEEKGRWLTPPAKRVVEERLFAQGLLKRRPSDRFDQQTFAALEALLVAK